LLKLPRGRGRKRDVLLWSWKGHPKSSIWKNSFLISLQSVLTTGFGEKDKQYPECCTCMSGKKIRNKKPDPAVQQIITIIVNIVECHHSQEKTLPITLIHCPHYVAKFVGTFTFTFKRFRAFHYSLQTPCPP